MDYLATFKQLDSKILVSEAYGAACPGVSMVRKCANLGRGRGSRYGTIGTNRAASSREIGPIKQSESIKLFSEIEETNRAE